MTVPPPGLILGGNHPAMRLDDPFADCQAQPSTVDIAWALYPIEFIKNALQIFRRNTNPLIDHFYLSRTLLRHEQ